MTTKTPKRFNAVAESRKWREATSRELFAMTREERREFLRTQADKFYAVAESHKWREASSRRLNAMTVEERIAYLNGATERLRASLRRNARQTQEI